MAKDDFNFEGSDGGPLPGAARYGREMPSVVQQLTALGGKLTAGAVHKAWIAIEGGMVRGYETEAYAEQAAIEEARRNPGKTISVLKAVRAYRTDEPTVKSVPVEG